MSCILTLKEFGLERRRRRRYLTVRIRVPEQPLNKNWEQVSSCHKTTSGQVTEEIV